jgi:hypothetical protein
LAFSSSAFWEYIRVSDWGALTNVGGLSDESREFGRINLCDLLLKIPSITEAAYSIIPPADRSAIKVSRTNGRILTVISIFHLIAEGLLEIHVCPPHLHVLICQPQFTQSMIEKAWKLSEGFLSAFD